MKMVFTFLVVFCALLLKGPNPVFAQTLQNVEPYIATQHLQKEVAPGDFASLDFSILQKTTGADKVEYVYNIENEDDDILALGKYHPIVVVLVYASLTLFVFAAIKHHLPFCKHLSYAASHTYLRQRVLRI